MQFKFGKRYVKQQAFTAGHNTLPKQAEERSAEILSAEKDGASTDTPFRDTGLPALSQTTKRAEVERVFPPAGASAGETGTAVTASAGKTGNSTAFSVNEKSAQVNAAGGAFDSSACKTQPCHRVLSAMKKAELRQVEAILRTVKETLFARDAGKAGVAETGNAVAEKLAAVAKENSAATEECPTTGNSNAAKNTAAAAETTPAAAGTTAAAETNNAAAEKTVTADIFAAPAENTMTAKRHAPFRVREAKEKRGLCEKHFALADGRFETVVYAAPVHVRSDETGGLFDMENGVKETEEGFFAQNNGFEGRFAKRTTSGALFTLKNRGGELRFAVAGAAKETAGVGALGAVVYPAVCGGADLMYRVLGNRVKEDIVISKKQDAYEYDFIIETDGLTSALSETGDRVLFKSKEDGNVLFTLPLPVMEDAAGEESYDVCYVMTETSSGYLVKVQASAEWINDEARVFPVRIDPQVIVSALGEEEKSIQVFRADYNEGFMHAVTPDETTVKVGKESYGNSYRVYYKIRFPESLIESDKVVESASLHFSVLGSMYSSTHHMGDSMEINRLQAQIGDGYGFRTEMPGEKMGEYYFPDEGYDFSLPFDAEELNQKLAVGERTYYLELKNVPPKDGVTSLAYTLYFNVPTEYHPTAAPTLHVTYRNANQENEDHVSEYGAGSAGKAGVNLLSGNKTYTHVDVSAEGKLLTAVEHRFNERRSVGGFDCDVDVTHGKTMKVSPPHCMGSGWKLNLQRYLVNRNRGDVLDEQITVLKYADERGAIIPFYEKMYYEKDGQRVFVTGDKLKKDEKNLPVVDENGNFATVISGTSYPVMRAYFDEEQNVRILLGEEKAHFFNLVQDAPDKKLYYYYDADMKKVSVEPNEKGVFSYQEGYFIYNGKPYVIDLAYTAEKNGVRVFQVDEVDYPVSVIVGQKKICREQGLPCFYRIRQEKALCNGKTDSQATELSAQNEIVYLIPDGLSACAKYMTEEIARQVSAIAELRAGIKQTEGRIDALKKDKTSADTDIARKIAALQEEYEAKANALRERETKMQQQELESRKKKLSAQQTENDAVIDGMQEKANQLKPEAKKDSAAALYDDYTYVYSSATGQYVETEDNYNKKYEEKLAKNNGNWIYSPQYQQQEKQALQAKINVHEQYKQYRMSIDRLNDSQTEITSALNSIERQEQYYQAKTELDNLAADIAREQKLQEKTTTEERNAYYDEQIAAAEQDLGSLQDQKFTAENKLRNLLAQEKKEVLDFMVDGSGKYFGFDYYGRLCAIGTGEKKFNRIVWREDNKIDGITDENGITLVSFRYAGGRLISIFDAENRETHFSYDAGNLTRIRYPETVDADGKKPGAVTLFAYENGVMTQIKDRMGHAYDFAKTAADAKVTVVVTEKAYNDAVDEDGIITASQATAGTVETVTVDLDKHTAKLKGPAETVRIAYDSKDNELYSYRYHNYDDVEGEIVPRVRDLSYHFKGKNVEYSVAVNKENNLLANGSFDSAFSSGWTALSESDVEIVSGTGAAGGNKSLKMLGGTAKVVRIMQNLDVSKLGRHKCFALSGWGKADSLPVDRENVLSASPADQTPTFALLATVTYSDGKAEYFRANFNHFDKNWQFAAVPVLLDPTKTVKSIAISAEYCYNKNNAFFTGLRFAKDAVTFTETKANKTLQRTVEDGEYSTYLNYQNNRPVQIKTVDRFGRVVTRKLRYDRNGNLLYAENTDGDVSENEYDDNGVLLRSATYHKKDPSSRFVTESETDDYGRTVKEYTPRGEFPDGTGAYTSYTYYGNSGRVRTVVSPSGAKLYCGYDAVSKRKISLTQSACDQDNTMKLRYDAGLLTAVETGDDGKVSYKYDGFGRVTEIRLDGTLYCTVAYPDHYGSRTVTYANGDKKSWNYDSYGNFTALTYTPAGSTSAQMMRWQTYNTTIDECIGGSLYTGEGTKSFSLTHTNGRLTEWSFGNDAVNYTYDTYGRLTGRNATVDGSSVSTTFTYDPERGDRLKSATCGYFVHELLYDDLGRVKGKVHTFTGTENAREQYSFVKSGDHATGLISSIRYARGANGKMDCTLQYRYDKAGNISAVYENGKLLSSYEYDALGRLTRENAVQLGKTTTFVYDGNGNILVRREYPYTVGELNGDGTEYLYAYAAAKRNRLLSYQGEAVVYDLLGNPTTYRGKALTFTRCHLVSSFDGTAFVYDGDGNRVKKTPQSGTATEYFYADGTLYKEKTGTDDLVFCRDEDGKICSIMYDSAPYILRKNAQGDVIALCDSNGAVVARYVYDAWGKHKVLNPDGTENTSAGFIGNINPIRYRGYYFDKDLGLYWLKTRFYDPQTGRFISPDSVEYLDPETLGGINLYAYCNNNPVMNVDPNGTMPKWLKWVIGGAVIVGLGIATIATGGAAAGVAGFIVSGALKGAVIGAASGALVSGTIGGIKSAAAGNDFWDGFADGAADGFMSGAIVGGATGALKGGLQVAKASKAWVSAGGKTSFKQMTEHYTKHVINEGQKSVAKSIVNYTKQAKIFFANNQTSGYLLRDGVIKIAGQPGGIFNINGLIRSFWYV